MCSTNEDTILLVMNVSKSMYKQYEDVPKIKKSSLLYSSVLIYIYSKGNASTLDMYHLIPYAKGSQINILNTLIDLGYIYKHAKKVERSIIYSVTEVGRKLVAESFRSKLNTTRTPNKYKTKATRT